MKTFVTKNKVDAIDDLVLQMNNLRTKMESNYRNYVTTNNLNVILCQNYPSILEKIMIKFKAIVYNNHSPGRVRDCFISFDRLMEAYNKFIVGLDEQLIKGLTLSSRLVSAIDIERFLISTDISVDNIYSYFSDCIDVPPVNMEFCDINTLLQTGLEYLSHDFSTDEMDNDWTEEHYDGKALLKEYVKEETVTVNDVENRIINLLKKNDFITIDDIVCDYDFSNLITALFFIYSMKSSFEDEETVIIRQNSFKMLSGYTANEFIRTQIVSDKYKISSIVFVKLRNK